MLRLNNGKRDAAEEVVRILSSKEAPPADLLAAGQEVLCAPGSLTGHGILRASVETRPEESAQNIEEGSLIQEGKHHAFFTTLNGALTNVNSLLYVRPLHSRYVPEIGDVVVGRVLDIGQGRWMVDIGSQTPGVLQISAIALPTGEQRRKTDAEVTDLRRFFQENDIICMEVQKVASDGGCLLHTRNTRYGKLANGCWVCVPPTLIQRLAQHSQTLPSGVHVVIGNNGYIWIGSPPTMQSSDTLNFTASAELSEKFEPVSIELRLKIARVRNSILFLAKLFVHISPASIHRVYEVTSCLAIPISEVCEEQWSLPILQAAC